MMCTTTNTGTSPLVSTTSPVTMMTAKKSRRKPKVFKVIGGMMNKLKLTGGGQKKTDEPEDPTCRESSTSESESPSMEMKLHSSMPPSHTSLAESSMSLDVMAHILSFLPLGQVVQARTVSTAMAKAGQLAIQEKLRVAGFDQHQMSHETVLETLSLPQQQVRHKMVLEFRRVKKILQTASSSCRAVEMQYLPLVPSSPTMARLEPLLVQPKLYARYAWTLQDATAQEHEVGLDLRASCWRVQVTIAQCLQEYRQVLQHFGNVLAPNHFRVLDLMLNKEMETLDLLQARGYTQAFVSFVAKLPSDGMSTSTSMNGSIYEKLTQTLQEPLLQQAIAADEDPQLEKEDVPRYIDLAQAGVALRLTTTELPPLFQQFDRMLVQHTRKKVAHFLMAT